MELAEQFHLAAMAQNLKGWRATGVKSDRKNSARSERFRNKERFATI